MKANRLQLRSAQALVAAMLLVSQPLIPATIQVGGGCSLAQAITAANDDAPFGNCPGGSGADELWLSANVSLGSPLPEVTSEIALRGNGFRVRRNATAAEFGIFAVAHSGDLTLDNLFVSGGAEARGGIANDGSLTVVNSTLSDNVSTSFFGGGAITNSGTLFLSTSTLSGNSAYNGGGVWNEGSTYISASRIESNHATARGGGVYSYAGPVTIVGSTISGNTVAGGSGAPGHFAGGGLFTYWPSVVSLVNSTVSGNSVGGGNGGGLFNYYNETLTLINTTVAENSAPNGTAIYQYIASTTLVDSVVSGTCTSSYAFVDGGNNFGCGFGTLSGLDPVLAHNGGPTPTHALEPGSSAIDAAGACAEPNDQRGFGRRGDCDSGAFEAEGERPAVGASVSGLDSFRALCDNQSSGQRVQLPLGGAGSWNCEAAGLVVNTGDVVDLVVIGRAQSATVPISGSVAGIRLESTICKGPWIQIFPAGLGSSWDCTAAGMEVSAGERVQVHARGTVD